MSQLLDVDLTPNECPTCGAVDWVSKIWLTNRQSDRAAFWCRNGHQQSFTGESDAVKAARLERVVKDLQRQTDNLTTERRQLLEKVRKLTPPRKPRIITEKKTA